MGEAGKTAAAGEHGRPKHRSSSKDPQEGDDAPKRGKSSGKTKDRGDEVGKKSRSGKRTDEDSGGSAGDDRAKAGHHGRDRDKRGSTHSRKSGPTTDVPGGDSQLSLGANAVQSSEQKSEVPPGGCPFDWGEMNSDLSTSFSEYLHCSHSLSIDNLEESASFHHHRELEPGDVEAFSHSTVKGEFNATFTRVDGPLPPQSRLVVRRLKRDKPHKNEKVVRVKTDQRASICYKKAKKSTVVEVSLCTAGTPFAVVKKKLRDLDLSGKQQNQTWVLLPVGSLTELGTFSGNLWKVAVAFSFVAA